MTLRYRFYILIILLGIFKYAFAQAPEQNAPIQNNEQSSNWYDNFLFKDKSFVFQFIRTLGEAIYGGGDLGECVSTARNIKEADIYSWQQEWLKTADRINQLAGTMNNEGDKVSAREAFFRASNYYRNAGFYMVAPKDRSQAAKNAKQSIQAFSQAIKDLPYIKPIRIPYGKTALPGYFLAAKNKNAPLLIIQTGFDGTAEELYFEVGLSAYQRGYNVLLFEGPGQGEMIMQQGVPFRPDWEAVIKPVVDYAEQLPKIDTKRIALLGISMGGYLAPRACAFESRLQACIANGGVWDISEEIKKGLPKNLIQMLNNDPKEFDRMFSEEMKKDVMSAWFFNNGMWRFNANSPSDLLKKMESYNLSSVVDKIKMPILIIDSEDDFFAKGQAKKLFDSIQGPKSFLPFTREETAQAHCQAGALAISNELILNWLDKTLDFKDKEGDNEKKKENKK